MKKRRSSILTIAIVIALFVILAFVSSKIANNIAKDKEKNNKENVGYEYTNYHEEDKMQYEYSKLNKKLNGIYALAIVDDNIVGVKSYSNVENICKIDPNISYDYAYSNGNMYLVEKESGKLFIVELKEFNNQEQENGLNPNVDSIQVIDDTIYYTSDGCLYKYNNGQSSQIYTNVTSNNFVIKNKNTYICIDKNLYKIDENGTQNIIDSNVEEIYYTNYYEKDRLVYDKSIGDGIITKNVYNFYLETSTTIIRNNTQFLLFDANEYVYTSNDLQDVVHITKEHTNEYLYKNKRKNEGTNTIKNIELFKEGYLLVVTENEKSIIDLSTNDEIIIDNIMNLQNIRYLK